MKTHIKKIFFAALIATSLHLLAQEKKAGLEPFKPDVNLAKMDRLDHSGQYLEKLSIAFKELQDQFDKERTENKQLKNELSSLKQSLLSLNNEQLEKINKRLLEVETKLSVHDLDQFKADHDQLRIEFDKLNKDYAQAKAMLEQIKLLIITDYASRSNNQGTSNNKLKGIVEEINKIQLPKPTPVATATPVATVTPVATSTPAATATAAATPAAPKEESFIDKYPLPARQSFCRKPENLRKFKKECLPYL